MYIKDGSDISYGSGRSEPYTYSWGWLGNKVESSGWSSQSLKDKIISKLSSLDEEYICNRTRGFHVCEICKEPLGNAEIKISYGGKILVAPSAVDHYMLKHDYCPDQFVLDAIIDGVFLKESDLNPPWREIIKMSEDELTKARDNKLKDVLIRGSLRVVDRSGFGHIMKKH